MLNFGGVVLLPIIQPPKNPTHQKNHQLPTTPETENHQARPNLKIILSEPKVGRRRRIPPQIYLQVEKRPKFTTFQLLLFLKSTVSATFFQKNTENSGQNLNSCCGCGRQTAALLTSGIKQACAHGNLTIKKRRFRRVSGSFQMVVYIYIECFSFCA